MDEVLIFVAYVLIEILLLKTGAVLVRLLSLGRWQTEAIWSTDHRVFGAAGSLSFVKDGTRFVSNTGLIVLAIVFWTAIGLATYRFWVVQQ